MYDIKFEQAKFVKLTKKGRETKTDKENIEPTIEDIQFKQLNTQISFYLSLNRSTIIYNSIQQQQQLQHFLTQKQLFPIFQTHTQSQSQTPSILLKPQTPKAKRARGRPKKNTPALSTD